MFITIKLYSTDNNSLQKFVKFLTEKICKTKNACIIVNSSSKEKMVKTKFTVLKSPHVNKTAQEQFEIRNYGHHLSIYSYQTLFLLVILKRINKSLYRDLKMKISITHSNDGFFKSLKNDLDCNKFNFRNNTLSNFNPTQFSLLESYLSLLDIQGEMSFKKRLGSSVG